MADVIARLKVDSTEYDSKIKRATQGLLAMEQSFRKAGTGLDVLLKDEREFVASLGKMETVSNTARGRLNELTQAYTELSIQYKRLTDEEKKGDFGKALSGSLEQLKGRIGEAKQQLKEVDAELADVDKEMKNVSADGGVMGDVMNAVAGKFGLSAQAFTKAGLAIAGVGLAYKLVSDNIETAKGFEKSMSGLSALTGMTGQELERLKEYAIELGSTSTLTASQVADAFRMIGSQQPQLLESGEALKEVTKYAIQLSEAAGIELETAAQTLSTSINQMGGDSDNAARYVNVLAAASQKGAGDIAWLGEAITKSATAAKAVGTDYEELVANLEQLAKAGFDASTAGTALRSIIMNLEKQANNNFKPSVVGLTQAFENLGKAQLDISAYQDIVGKMFATQAMALANAAGEAKNMEVAITGTNIAEEQATTNTSNLDGAIKSLASAWEGLNLHLNSSNSIITELVGGMKDLVTWADQAFTSAGRVTKIKNQRDSTGRVSSEISDLGKAQNKQSYYNQAVEDWQDEINKARTEANRLQKQALWNPFVASQADDATAKVKALKDELADYKRQAQAIINPGPVTSPTTATVEDAVVSPSTDTKGKGGKKTSTKKETWAPIEMQAVGGLSFGRSIKDVQADLSRAQGAYNIAEDESSRAAAKKMVEAYQKELEMMKNEGDVTKGGFADAYTHDFGKDMDVLAKELKNEQKTTQLSETEKVKQMGAMVGGIQQMVGGIAQLGIEIPEGFQSMLGGLQGIMTILQAIQTIQTVGSVLGLFRNGGIVPHAATGLMVPGNDFSDSTPVMVSSGELILNKAQQNAVAQGLQEERGRGDYSSTPYVDGEKIYLGMNNFLRRSGRGEIVTSRR